MSWWLVVAQLAGGASGILFGILLFTDWGKA